MSSQEKKDSKAVVIGVMVALAVVLVVVCVAFAMYIRKTNSSNINATEEETKKREYVVTKDNVEEIREELQETLSDAYYTVTMTTEWTCSAATNESKDAYIANSTDNNRTVYFNLLLPNTGEVIYSSPFIPVGEELKGLTLDKGLPVGKNTVWVEYHLVDENEQELTTVTVTATITVK